MKKLWLKKKSQIHGDGLYALEDIAKGKKIIEYIGEKINKKEGDRRADRQITRAKKNKKNGMVYVFELNSRYDIDGSFAYNHARLINHSCNPNCEVETINNRLWISSIKNIKKQYISKKNNTRKNKKNYFIIMDIHMTKITRIIDVNAEV